MIIEFLTSIDSAVFLFLNGLHTAITDFLMLWVSNKWIWIPLYIILIYAILKREKNKGFLAIGFLILLVIITDLTSVHVFKELFQRLRPCHNPEIMESIHMVGDNCGGKFGFVSSHAANHFGLAVFLSRLFQNRKFSAFIYIWASIIAYSRIYIGVHYPGDVIGGIILGIIMGFIIWKLYKYFYIKYLVIKKRDIII